MARKKKADSEILEASHTVNNMVGFSGTADVKFATENIKVESNMPGFTVDMTGVTVSNLVEEGVYEASLTKVTLKNPSAVGKPHRLVFEFTIDDAEADESVNGKKVYTSYQLVPDFLWAWKKDVLTLGADAEDTEGSSVDVVKVSNDLRGRKIVANVTVEENSYKPGEQVNRTSIAELSYSR